MQRASDIQSERRVSESGSCSGGGEKVIFCAPRVRRHFPLRRHPRALQQPLQGRIKRAVIHHELIPGLPFEELANAISVIGPGLQTAQDEHLQRPLQKLHSFQWIIYRRHTTYIRGGPARCQDQALAAGYAGLTAGRVAL